MKPFNVRAKKALTCAWHKYQCITVSDTQVVDKKNFLSREVAKTSSAARELLAFLSVL